MSGKQKYILFRFHRAYDVCLQNVRLLRTLNPDCVIHGMYGGRDTLGKIPAALKRELDTLWAVPIDDSQYKWMHGDLCVRWWFKDVGHRYRFEHLYLIEWDLLYTRPLTEVFPFVKKGRNYAALHATYAQALRRKWHWVVGHYGYEFRAMKKHIKETLKVEVKEKQLSFPIMGGAIFCRRFLERYVKADVKSFSNDETRFSVYSAAFSIPLDDNRLLSNKANFVDANNNVLTETAALSYLATGALALHPVRKRMLRLCRNIRNK